MDRDTCRLRDIPAVAIEDRGGIVEQLAHDGGAAGAPDRDVHLGGRRGQRVVDDLELDRRDRRAALHLCSPRDQVAALVARGSPAVGEQHGGIGLLDHRRARRRSVERRSASRFHTGDLAPGAGHPRRVACRSALGRRPGCRIGSRPAPADGRWPITRSETISTGAAGVGIGEALAMDVVEIGDQRRQARSHPGAMSRAGHGELEGLALVAHVGGERDLPVAGGTRVRRRAAHALPRSDSRPSARDGGKALGPRRRAPASARGRAPGWNAGCRRPTACWRSPGTRALDADLVRDRRCMQPAGAAEGRSSRTRAGRGPSRTATGESPPRDWHW